MDIIKPTDSFTVESIIMLIFGVPGVGKTSLGCSAPNTLLLDFDLGAHRSEFRADTVQIKDWNAAAALIGDADLANYDVITIDTIGRALDVCTAQLIKDNPKNARSDGTLSLQGWGALKGTFVPWVTQLRLLGKDIIMLAHNKEKDVGDYTENRPDIQGGTYAEVFKLADSAGWLGPGGEHWHGVLEFDPTPLHPGKNPGHIEPVGVPNLAEKPHFLIDLIARIKERLGAMGERGRMVAEEVDTYREGIAKLTTIKGINDMVEASLEIEDRAVQTQVKHLVNDRAKELGLRYDKDKKAFTGAAKPEDVPPPPKAIAGGPNDDATEWPNDPEGDDDATE